MMSSTNEEDPFLQVQAYAFLPSPSLTAIATPRLRNLPTLITTAPTNVLFPPRSDVLSLLSTTRPLFASYLRIRSLSPSPTSPELTQSRTELESTLQDLSADLADLVESIRAVEGDPYRYGLEIDEVERRRRLVTEVGDEVEGMREELARTVMGAGSGAGGGSKRDGQGAANGNGKTLPSPSAYGRLSPDDDDNGDGRSYGEGGGYAAFEQQRQVEMMHEQDEALDGVFQTVGNLRRQADDMGRELEEQGEMLEDVDTLADRVGGKLQGGLKRVGWVIRKNEDTMSSCCIAMLILVLILLLILVLVL